jgi:structural maintenance of chromosome 4
LKRAKDLEQVTASRDNEKQKYDSLSKERLDGFMAGFSTISLKLKEMYQVSASGIA